MIKTKIVTIGHQPPPITGENMCRARLERVLEEDGVTIHQQSRTLRASLWFGSFEGAVIVNGQSLYGSIYDMLLSCWLLLRGNRVWFYFHNRSWLRYTHFPFRAILRCLCGKKLRMLVLTSEIADTLRKAGFHAQILNNTGGCEFDELAAQANPPPCMRLLWMGRAEAAKGFLLSIEAFLQLKDSDNNWHYNVYGSDGTGLLKIKGVTYHGFVGGEDKLSAFEAGGIFILPSSYSNETQPLSIIEALAAGLPVVASDAGGIGEMLELDGMQAGVILTKNQLTPVGCAEAIRLCLQRYEEFSTVARLIYRRKYSNKVYVENVKEAFLRLS